MSYPTKETAFSPRSRAAQLTEFLRVRIRSGAMVSSLPGTRRWSEQLGVSRRMLGAAIKELRHEGWISVPRRGTRLRLKSERTAATAPAPRSIRMLLFRTLEPSLAHHLATYRGMAERLAAQGVALKWEIAYEAQLRAIAAAPRAPSELLVLIGVPFAYQQLLTRAGRSVLIWGEPAPELPLPFISVDVGSAVSHAANRLMRHGFEHLVLLYPHGESGDRQASTLAFDAACAQWPRQPVASRLVPTALDGSSLTVTIRRLVGGLRGRTGLIVLAPVHIGMVVSALLQYQIAIPGQVEVAALFHTPEAAMLFPPLLRYRHPAAAMEKYLSKVAHHYFATGHLPPMAKRLISELAE